MCRRLSSYPSKQTAFLFGEFLKSCHIWEPPGIYLLANGKALSKPAIHPRSGHLHINFVLKRNLRRGSRSSRKHYSGQQGFAQRARSSPEPKPEVWEQWWARAVKCSAAVETNDRRSV